jgi:quercetin dioxygenase-like cupin family protein
MEQIYCRAVNTWTVMLCIVAAMSAPVLTSASAAAQMPGRCESPVSKRTSAIGCFVLDNQPLGLLPRTQLFWHLYVFPSRAAANSAKAPQQTIVEEFGKVWLFAIAPQNWHPSAGERVSIVGPLPHSTTKSYTARYLVGVVPPGEHTPVHTHAGPEAWYLLAGAECLETPEGITVAHAGGSAVVKEGLPMMLSSVGTETRNAFALILHDSSLPWTMVMPKDGWKPKGLCPK